MTPETTSDGLSVRYQLTVQGQPAELDAFLAKVHHPDLADKLFQPSRAVPIPTDIEAVDPFSIPYYHIIQNQHGLAAAALEALDAEPELVELLKDPSRLPEARELMNRTLDREAMAGVAAVRKNVRHFNALTRAQWAVKNWGQFDDRLTCAQLERVSDRRAVYHFTWHVLAVTILDRLSTSNPTLAFGLIGVDELNQKQAYAWHCEATCTFHHGACDADPGRPNWLENPPAVFSAA
jgi:hypothetical protein